MPTTPPEEVPLARFEPIRPAPAEPAPAEPHEARHVAESFGIDPERYDRSRPRYPQALVDQIVAESPGSGFLDVGCGTGIAARQFAAVGRSVLGVEPDERMAALARQRGIAVELAKFEEWDPAGRVFDAVVAGQAWHWIDPVVGAARAAQALRPGGRLAPFWYVFQPSPDLAEAFRAVSQQVLLDSPVWRGAPSGGLDSYAPILTRVADGIRKARAFSEPEQWRYEWDQRYTRQEWLEMVPTAGGLSQLSQATLRDLLVGIGAVIDAFGGSFSMHFTAIAVTAVRCA